MPNPKKETFEGLNSDSEDIDTIDLDFLELFDVLNAKEIIKLLNATGGNFTAQEGSTIKKLAQFLRSLDDDQLDKFLDAFDEIMEGE